LDGPLPDVAFDFEEFVVDWQVADHQVGDRHAIVTAPPDVSPV
jgi:hypothetical protein